MRRLLLRAIEALVGRVERVEGVVADVRGVVGDARGVGAEELFGWLEEAGVVGRLAERMYPDLRRRLRKELLVDRERHGVLADVR
ncbi:hypothetical protein [Kribbella hippodromi]